MNPTEMSAMVSAFTVVIADAVPDVTDLAIVAISIKQLSTNIDAIVAQRLLLEKRK